MDSCRNKLKKLSCPECKNVFSTNFTRNRHIRKFHPDAFAEKRQKPVNRIICPICKIDNNPLQTFSTLETHLEEKHEKIMERKVLKFADIQEYTKWQKTEKIEVKYCIYQTYKTNLYKKVLYVCNRSNMKGYKNNYKVRTEKASGSIKISGVCPSRYEVKFYKNGKVIISIQQTHVGHIEELYAQHLSCEEKNIVVDKLKAGVTVERILEDARGVSDMELSRINVLNRKDINYLVRKHNIGKRRHEDDIHNNKLQQFISGKDIEHVSTTNQEFRKEEWESFQNFMQNLDKDTFNTVIGRIMAIKKEVEEKPTSHQSDNAIK